MIISAVLEEHLIIQQLCLEMKSTQCQTKEEFFIFYNLGLVCLYIFFSKKKKGFGSGPVRFSELLAATHLPRRRCAATAPTWLHIHRWSCSQLLAA